MSGLPKAPAAPRLRAIREVWLRPVMGQLEADPDICAVGFVGSIGLRQLSDTFDEHLAKREFQPPTPKPASAHRLLQIALVPVAAKRIARRSPDAGRMVEFVGGPHAPDAAPAAVH
jgi:hypothetical protein